MRLFFFTLAFGSSLAAFAGNAEAEITIPLPLDTAVDRNLIDYDCGDLSINVEYINAGPVSLAVFAYEGEPVVASNVLAASGARYAGGRFIWWTKGADATLYDLTLGEDAPPAAECRQTG